eukprot:6613850-Pyramimonas_sp.AAC.2
MPIGPLAWTVAVNPLDRVVGLHCCMYCCLSVGLVAPMRGRGALTHRLDSPLGDPALPARLSRSAVIEELA